MGAGRLSGGMLGEVVLAHEPGRGQITRKRLQQ